MFSAPEQPAEHRAGSQTRDIQQTLNTKVQSEAWSPKFEPLRPEASILELKQKEAKAQTPNPKLQT